jgi:hypothetical protein
VGGADERDPGLDGDDRRLAAQRSLEDARSVWHSVSGAALPGATNDLREATMLRPKLPLLRAIAWVALLAAATPSLAATPAAPAFYLDCTAAAGGDGSRANPWNALDQANAHSFAPGELLLLRRGTSCSGTLAPVGAGAPGEPFTVGAYGVGPRPRVEGNGEDAILLRDTSHAVLQDLEVVNRGDFQSRRRGVHVVADDGVVSDVTVRKLYVHDVEGDLKKDENGSGGIQVDVFGSGRFAGLLIERNRIEDVSRSGIFIVAGSGTRPPSGQPWPEASTDVVVRGNRLTRIGGDGIVPLGTVGAVVEDNVLSAGNLRGRSFTDPAGPLCDAGIWTFNANDTLIQRNEVYAMKFNGCDGTGFDVDYAQDGTIVQYNYSHDNEGGFILLCTDPGLRRADVRFNLSVDDNFSVDSAPCAFPQIGTYAGLRFFNNTIVGRNPLLSFEGTLLAALFDTQNLEFRNNLFRATTPLATAFPCGALCSNNLFFGMPAAGVDPIAADPRFVQPRRRGLGRLRVGRSFRLKSDSPAIGAGTPVDASPDRDYFGRAIAGGTPPAIGMAQP